MTRPDRQIPPGHTKPPIRDPGLPESGKGALASLNPLSLPLAAKGVLLLAFVMTFGITLLGDDGRTGFMLLGMISAGAFGEAMRPRRDEVDALREHLPMAPIFDRALSNVFWVAIAMVPAAVMAGWLRQATGMEGMLPG